MKNSCQKVLIIGAGLAGCEASHFLANKGVHVVLYDGKKLDPNPSQRLNTFAELVCSNSLKSQDLTSAHGILKSEMSELGSLIMKVAKEVSVPAGGALAVDRVKFSERITELLYANPKIEIIEEMVSDPIEISKKVSADFTIIASGPLTSTPLETWIKNNLVNSKEDLYFYDAIAPVVDADSLDMDKLYFKDRYVESIDNGELPSYLNSPMDRNQYEQFILELIKAKKTPARDFENYKYFEGCLPIDLIAERGIDTPRFGCMKPVGLSTKNINPYAVVQLRKENLLGSAYNLVGFQTRLTYPEQKRVFKMIPGFEEAKFIHLGSVHRNTFVNARNILNFDLSSKKNPNIYIVGQLSGVEGYTESASMGLYAASQIYRRLSGKSIKRWPNELAIGALINYIMTCTKAIPSNINFGLFPEVKFDKSVKGKKNRMKLKRETIFKRSKDEYIKFMGDY